MPVTRCVGTLQGCILREQVIAYARNDHYMLQFFGEDTGYMPNLPGNSDSAAFMPNAQDSEFILYSARNLKSIHGLRLFSSMLLFPWVKTEMPSLSTLAILTSSLTAQTFWMTPQ
jgi:hypothetical protein